ncbi:unnamed protein product, partial [Prorocentrum cordatum]
MDGAVGGLGGDVDEYLQIGLHPVWWYGNWWDDYFAKEGALTHRASRVLVDIYQAELRHHQNVNQYLSRVMEYMVMDGVRQDPDLRPKPRKVGAPVQLAIQQHVRGAQDGYMRCMRCGEGAKGQNVKANLQANTCVPTELGRFKCQPSPDRLRWYVGGPYKATLASVKDPLQDGGPPIVLYVDELQLATGEPGPEDTEIYLRDLPLEDYTEQQLREWLDDFGTVTRFVAIRDTSTKELTGRAYVRFGTSEEATGLIAAFPQVADDEGNVK